MRKSFFTFAALMLVLAQALAQEGKPTLLNGTTLAYAYENGGAVAARFEDGLYHFEWVAGPYAGIAGSAPYESISLGKKKYAINFFVKEHRSYVTLLFDFLKGRMVGSAIIELEDQVIQSIEEAVITEVDLGPVN